MINLELDEREAWIVTHLLSRALDNPFMFTEVDEDDAEYFDDDLHSETGELYDKILKVRGFRLYEKENDLWGV